MMTAADSHPHLERLARSPYEGRWVATIRNGSVLLEVREADGTWRPDMGRDPFTVPRSPRESLPTVYQSDQVTILFDGILYNLAELSRSSASANPDVSPVEIIALLWQRHQEQAIPLLKGIFALIVVYRDGSRIVAARDPIGIYPLFYVRRSGQALFSTTVEALRLHPAVDAPVNRAALADHLRHQWPIPSETFFEGVSRVLPGTCLTLDADSVRGTRYWDPMPDEQMHWVGQDELQRFDGLLEQAVSRCLQFGSPGIFLSGGLDSISVAAVATQLCRERGARLPHGLSLVFPDPEANEERVQRAVAGSLGIEHSVVELQDAAAPCGLLESAFAFSRTWPNPLINIWYPAYFRMTRDFLPDLPGAILTGTGGDEFFGVSPALAADLLGEGRLLAFYQFVRSAHRSFHLSPARTLQVMVWQEGARALIAREVRSLLLTHARGHYARRWWRNIHGQIPAWLAPDPALRRRMDDRIASTMPARVDKSLYLRDSRQSLDHPLTSLEFEDHFESGRRLNRWVMHPLMDADLIHFVYRLRPEELYRGGRAKTPLRDRLTRQFPELGFDRQRKVDAQGSYRRTLLDEGPSMWTSVGGAHSLAALGVIEERGLEEEIQRTFRDRAMGPAFRVWDVLSTEGFTRGHES